VSLANNKRQALIGNFAAVCGWRARVLTTVAHQSQNHDHKQYDQQDANNPPQDHSAAHHTAHHATLLQTNK